jgi:hypothetical protein
MYIYDSQIISSILLIFRRAVITLSYDTNPLLKGAMLDIPPSEFSNNFKVMFVYVEKSY